MRHRDGKVMIIWRRQSARSNLNKVNSVWPRRAPCQQTTKQPEHMNHHTSNNYVVTLGLAFSLLAGARAPAADSAAPGAKEVANLVGTYSGTWTSFGVDAEGKVVKRMAWTDTMKAEKPVREAGRVFVATEDEMIFEGRPGAPFKIPGKEGYLLNTDGTLGDYFIETYGQTYRVQAPAKGVWTYAVDAQPQELAQLGFPKGATGRHVMVKVMTQEEGVETHRISRVTTVNWTAADGKERWLQYVSLQGVHKKRS